jgi:hypothetical protein
MLAFRYDISEETIQLIIDECFNSYLLNKFGSGTRPVSLFFAGSSSAPYTTSQQRRAASRYYLHDVLIGAVVDVITGKKNFR